MLFDWISFLAYLNLFEIKGFIVVVIIVAMLNEIVIGLKKVIQRNLIKPNALSLSLPPTKYVHVVLSVVVGGALKRMKVFHLAKIKVILGSNR
jgi:hypothetical protein